MINGIYLLQTEKAKVSTILSLIINIPFNPICLFTYLKQHRHISAPSGKLKVRGVGRGNMIGHRKYVNLNESDVNRGDN